MDFRIGLIAGVHFDYSRAPNLLNSLSRYARSFSPRRPRAEDGSLLSAPARGLSHNALRHTGLSEISLTNETGRTSLGSTGHAVLVGCLERITTNVFTAPIIVAPRFAPEGSLKV